MNRIFVIVDEIHAEWGAQFQSLEETWAELRRLSKIPWDQEPNVAPCDSWKTCGRQYEIVEFDASADPWLQTQKFDGLEINAKGVSWGEDAPKQNDAVE